ncbi:hypothetical protein TCAL_12138 [Tigriopus californicus]|uniref:Uncharacterized protein n=1 Tax=Tigriopus californicus TaxID=6832 RepID=A0A553PBC1_TIGCA|nr:probable transcriptional regulatory protein Kole_1935 [Tigriopus californicus]TRY74985.1 hypothetical protein TCAL_12138 [Tigriopus californicus]|eukprot:TCALIF_12138-PA protein Name:"Similar to Kole_1935 Probable transcriptional regulatory protein Kole_1935 (Kosmotoga olearia (strain TBF 19.5.1))" AED:0.03 eAED:0.03 QI:0/-1/0/1/-1/1/1/0/301
MLGRAGLAVWARNGSCWVARHSDWTCRAVAPSLVGRWPAPIWRVSLERAKGHSKWQNIRHIKGANDALRARLFNLYSSRIIMAIRAQGGQTNPELNRALKRALEEARAHDMPKATIDKAVAAASDKNMAQLVESWHEVRGPGRAALLIQCLAKNKRIAESAVQGVLRKRGGAFETGLTAMFDHVGEVTVQVPVQSDWDLNRAEDLAIECSAEDVTELTAAQDDPDHRYFMFACPPNQVSRLQDELTQQGQRVVHVESGYRPRTWSSPLSPLNAKMLEVLISTLEKNEIVVRVFHNAPDDTE